MSAERLPFDESFLKEKLKSDPTTWETRRQLAHGLYDKQAYAEAAEIIWTTDQIPSTDLDLAFAIRILAKAQPRRAIRLLTAILELNQGKAVQNMAMANALLHHGMVLQAARFYGAALEADPTLVNPDLEHFVLWSDDECTMWDLFDKHHPKLGELPWMLRDPKEALRLTSRISLHTTPIHVPELPIVGGEAIKHDLYQQEVKHQAKITPPPAVTIPIDRVDPKDRLFDADYGATVVSSQPEAESTEEVVPSPEAPKTPEVPVLEAPPVPAALSGVPSKIVFPDSSKPAAPAAPSAFPATVVFPDSSKPAASMPPLPVDAPALSKIPAATLISPSDSPAAASPAPSAAPFFADPTPPQAEAPLPSVIPFFADLAPNTSDAVPKAVSFLGDERLTGSVKLPPPAAVPGAKITEAAEENAAEEKAPENENRIPEAFPISQSAVPTQILRVKWSTSPARPGSAAAATPAPVAPPNPFAAASAPLPFAPAPTPFPAHPQLDEPEPAAAAPVYMPPPASVLPMAAPAGSPTGPPTRPLVPIAAPGGIPTGIPLGAATGAPTRALLPSGTPPPNPTGAPTRVLIPSGTPPENAGAPRRLLLTPVRPPSNPENQQGQ